MSAKTRCKTFHFLGMKNERLQKRLYDKLAPPTLVVIIRQRPARLYGDSLLLCVLVGEEREEAADEDESVHANTDAAGVGVRSRI